MSKISREALLEMAQEAGIAVHPLKQQARIGIDTITGDDSTAKLERFAEMVLAARDQQQRQTNPLAQDWQTEMLDWVSACQSAYYIDSTEGHRFGGLGSNLEENRAGIVAFVSDLLQSAHSTPPAVAIPAGYKLAPVEPTEEMCDAAAEGDGSEFIGEFRCIGRFDIAYKDALAVAPHPPAVSVPDDYAGVVIWIGDTKVAQVVSKEKIISEAVRGMEITNTAQDCLDKLASEIGRLDRTAQKGGAA